MDLWLPFSWTEPYVYPLAIQVPPISSWQLKTPLLFASLAGGAGGAGGAGPNMINMVYESIMKPATMTIQDMGLSENVGLIFPIRNSHLKPG